MASIQRKGDGWCRRILHRARRRIFAPGKVSEAEAMAQCACAGKLDRLNVSFSAVRDRSDTHLNWHHFRIDRQGYLTSRMIGYALALFAYARGEEGAAWSGGLRPDAGQSFKAGLRFLRKTGDTLFGADAAGRPARFPTEAEAVERLATGSPTVRAMTLVDISRMGPPPASLAGPVARSLRDGDTQSPGVEVRQTPPGDGFPRERV